MNELRLVLDRHPHGFTSTIGSLTLDDQPFCSTLEDLPHETKVPGQTCIPAGKYVVALIVSPEAVRGGLWTPNPNFLLPMVLSVPGFEGIRIHAGNSDRDTRGCILVGTWRGGEFLTNSRDALSSLMDMLEIAQIARRPISLEVNDPLKESP